METASEGWAAGIPLVLTRFLPIPSGAAPRPDPRRQRGQVPRTALHGLGASEWQTRVRRLPGGRAVGIERSALPGGRVSGLDAGAGL